jgi:hypothetical protein
MRIRGLHHSEMIIRRLARIPGRLVSRNPISDHPEEGGTLPATLWALGIGGLLVVPFLAYVSSSMLAGRQAQDDVREQYAANAGVEFGIWKLINDTAFRDQVDAAAGSPVDVDPPVTANQITTNTNAILLGYSSPGWVAVADAPGSIASGGDLTWDGGSYLYAVQGGGQDGHWRYSLADDSWDSMPDVPGDVDTGGAYVYGDSDHIYLLRGGHHQGLRRYDAGSADWDRMNSPEQDRGDGSDLEYDGGGRLYSLRGGDTADFERYSIHDDDWRDLQAAPANVSAGGALAYDGSGSIYALRCSGTPMLWRYGISSNSWSSLTDAPANFGSGCDLAFDGVDTLYALQGDDKDGFFSYSISDDSWDELTSVPAGVGDGGSLVYVDDVGLFATNGGHTSSMWLYPLDTPLYQVTSQAGSYTISARLTLEGSGVTIESWHAGPPLATLTPTEAPEPSDVPTATAADTPTPVETSTPTATPGSPPPGIYWFYNDRTPRRYMMYPSQPSGRNTYSSTSRTFYSDTFGTDSSIPSGTATIYFYAFSYYHHCTYNISLYGGSTLLGSGTVDVSRFVYPIPIYSADFSVSDYDFSPGERLSVRINPCHNSWFYWDGTHNDSRIELPGVSAPGATTTPTPTATPDNWWNPNWHYRREITVDSSKVDSDLSDFPVLVHLDESNFDFSKARSSGQDIRFIDPSAIPQAVLSYEIEHWDSGDRQADIWVNVPAVDASADTELFMYYGNSGASDAQDAAGTWSNGYVAVVHMSETGGMLRDSTGRGNDGSLSGGSRYLSDEWIDGGHDFDGSNDRINVSDSEDLNTGGPYTDRVISVWFNVDTTYPRQVLYSQGSSDRGFNLYVDSGRLYIGAWNRPYHESNWDGTWLSTSISSHTWYMATLRLVGGTGTIRPDRLKAYLNGVEFGSGSASQVWGDDGNVALARSRGSSRYHTGNSDADNYLNGSLDEWRVSNVSYSAAWTRADYNSQNNSLLHYAGEEARP